MESFHLSSFSRNFPELPNCPCLTKATFRFIPRIYSHKQCPSPFSNATRPSQVSRSRVSRMRTHGAVLYPLATTSLLSSPCTRLSRCTTCNITRILPASFRPHFSQTDSQQHPGTSSTALSLSVRTYITPTRCQNFAPHNLSLRTFTSHLHAVAERSWPSSPESATETPLEPIWEKAALFIDEFHAEGGNSVQTF